MRFHFIDGEEAGPEQGAEPIGALLGGLRGIMKSYPGLLARVILRKKILSQGRGACRIQNSILPRGYCYVAAEIRTRLRGQQALSA